MTGIAIELPSGYEAQVRPRSSLSLCQIDVALGTIDSDYRGEIGVIVSNRGQGYASDMYSIEHGQRIAQLVFAKTEQFVLEEVEQLETTERGSKGFGSTGEK